MIPYISYREIDDKGVLRYYVLQKVFPHTVGIILAQQQPEALAQFPISGYNLWVVYDGVLHGNFVHATPDYKNELAIIMQNMAAWFWAERICLDRKRFEKFKVKSNEKL
jgi:hypothetical protein